jgi:hypothetical protein
MLVEDTIAQLSTAVPELTGRIQGALELSELLRANQLPQSPSWAFVFHNGIAGFSAEMQAGAFIQAAEEIVSVVLGMRRGGDATGRRISPELHELVWKVLFGLCGWAPPDPEEPEEDEDTTRPTGVFVLRRGRVVSLKDGTALYQIDFAISQQIRVFT